MLVLTPAYERNVNMLNSPYLRALVDILPIMSTNTNNWQLGITNLMQINWAVNGYG